MIKTAQRQQKIVKIIKGHPGIQSSEIERILVDQEKIKIARITIIRDLEKLLSEKLIIKQGEGRNISYIIDASANFLMPIEVDKYFAEDPDKRNLAYKTFNFDIYKKLNNLFSDAEIKELNKINDNYSGRIAKLPPDISKKEIERLIIELSWKSSKIEGNTYSLIDTEILLKDNKEAKGHKKEEAIMLLNHKAALDYIFSSSKEPTKLTTTKITNIHSLLVKNLGVGQGIRKKPVGITGTAFKPLDNQHQILEALEKAVNLINKAKYPLEKALLANVLIAYIQPFEDGNKRTSRLLANALLLANGYCPLSFRSINEAEYKKAVILFYEQNNLAYFKQLLVEQYKFSVANYFR